jgi:MarR family transcriptional regulator for hemolysin
MPAPDPRPAGALGRCLDTLEAQGLIERRPHDRDRRAKLVHLTESAGSVLEEINRIAADLRHELLADVPPEDLHACLTVFRHIELKMRGPNDACPDQKAG